MADGGTDNRLDDVILRLRAAAASADDPADRGRYLTVLAAAMERRFRTSADPADLDDAVTFGRAARADLPDGVEAPPALGRALLARFRLRGTLADLGEALETAGVSVPDSAVVAWARRAWRNAAVSRPGVFLRGADLQGRDLRGADLSGADLTGCRLSRADLTGANLAGARLAHAHLDRARLTDAVLSGADLTAASLAGADLTGADLSGTVLCRAVLVGATLPDGPVAGAYLTGPVREVARIVPPPSAGGIAFDRTGDLALVGGVGQLTLLDTASGLPVGLWGDLIRFEPVEGSIASRIPEAFENLLHGPLGEAWVEPPDDLDDWDEDDSHSVATVALSPAGTTAAVLESALLMSYGEIHHTVTLTVVDLDGRPRAGSIGLDTDGLAVRTGFRDRRVRLGFSPDGRWLVALCEWEAVVVLAVPEAWPGDDADPLWSDRKEAWNSFAPPVGEADAWVSTDTVGGCFAFRPDGRRLALAGASPGHTGTTAAVRVVDPSTGTVLRHEPAGSGVVAAVSYVAEDRLSAVTACAGFALLWTWHPDDTGATRIPGDLLAADYTTDGGCVVLVDDDGATSLQRWNPATGTREWTTTVDAGPDAHLRCSPDGRWTAVADDTGITVRSAHDGIRVWTVAGSPGPDPATLAFDPRGRLTTGGGLTRRDVHTGAEIPGPAVNRADWELLGLTPVRAGSLDCYLGPAPSTAG